MGCARHYVEQDSVQSQGEVCFIYAWGTILALQILMAVFPLTLLGREFALDFTFLNQCMWGEGRSSGHTVARANV